MNIPPSDKDVENEPQLPQPEELCIFITTTENNLVLLNLGSVCMFAQQCALKHSL